MCKFTFVSALTALLLVGTTLREGTAFATDVSDIDLPLCIYVSSYSRGNEWSDRLESALRTTLSSSCRIVQFNMDSKRKRKHDELQASASRAYALIEKEKPAVVITSDDYAARYLIVPYLLDTDMPVVFSGINWTIEEYGFPADNVTGIVEVAPLAPLIAMVLQSVPDARRAAYFSAPTLTEAKNFARIAAVGRDNGLQIERLPAATMSEWIDVFNKLQDYDFVILGSVEGIRDWDKAVALQHAQRDTHTFVVTTHQWLMPYSSLGMTLVPDELGEWAANATKAVLDGASPKTIPIVTNRKWDTWINLPLVRASGAKVPAALMSSAKQVVND